MRWTLVRFFGWQMALHKICRSDDDRALHDHVGDNLSIVLRGQYTEMPDRQVYGSGNVVFRKAEKPHRLVLNPGEHVWTLWLRWPHRREWGFYCPKGWVHWTKFTSGGREGSSTIGRGCE
jgi:hypothetical protein